VSFSSRKFYFAGEVARAFQANQFAFALNVADCSKRDAQLKPNEVAFERIICGDLRQPLDLLRKSTF
jgi:hypothetical protein